MVWPVCALLMLVGCATVPKDPIALAAYRATDDPLEPMNRKVFAFNQGVDRAVLKPVAKGYVRVIPSKGRDGIRNFIKNLNEPVVFANNILQAQFKRAWMTTERFVLNSTVGVLGLMDFAGRHRPAADRSGISGKHCMCGDSTPDRIWWYRCSDPRHRATASDRESIF